MEGIVFEEIQDKETWEKFLLSQNPHSFLQSWNWGEVNKVLGHNIFRIGAFNKGKLVAICQIVSEKAKRGPHFIIPAGPVMDWNDGKIVSSFFTFIINLAKKEKVWFIRVRPEQEDSLEMRQIMKSHGFKNAPMHLHGENTLVVDLRPGESEILKRMRKNTRYAIKKSLDEDLTVEFSTKASDADVLFELQKETVGRHKFVGFRKELFQKEIDAFGRDGTGALAICRKNGIPLVSSIVIFYGQYAYYHHSGSSREALRLNATYFTQWQIIREAIKRGCSYYDLWGIAPDDNPGHRFAGVTIFKKGFGGERFDWIHAQDLAVSPFYFSTYIFETIRRKIRRL